MSWCWKQLWAVITKTITCKSHQPVVCFLWRDILFLPLRLCCTTHRSLIHLLQPQMYTLCCPPNLLAVHFIFPLLLHSHSKPKHFPFKPHPPTWHCWLYKINNTPNLWPKLPWRQWSRFPVGLSTVSSKLLLICQFLPTETSITAVHKKGFTPGTFLPNGHTPIAIHPFSIELPWDAAKNVS